MTKLKDNEEYVQSVKFKIVIEDEGEFFSEFDEEELKKSPEEFRELVREWVIENIEEILEELDDSQFTVSDLKTTIQQI